MSDAQFHRGLIFTELEKFDDAVDAFHAVTEQDPENTPALFYTGSALNRLGRYEDAIAVLNQLLLISPQNANAHVPERACTDAPEAVSGRAFRRSSPHRNTILPLLIYLFMMELPLPNWARMKRRLQHLTGSYP